MLNWKFPLDDSTEFVPSAVKIEQLLTWEALAVARSREKNGTRENERNLYEPGRRHSRKAFSLLSCIELLAAIRKDFIPSRTFQLQPEVIQLAARDRGFSFTKRFPSEYHRKIKLKIEINANIWAARCSLFVGWLRKFSCSVLPAALQLDGVCHRADFWAEFLSKQTSELWREPDRAHFFLTTLNSQCWDSFRLRSESNLLLTLNLIDVV